MSIFGGKKGNRDVNLVTIEETFTMPKGWGVNISMLDDKICIKARIGKQYPEIFLNYSQIVGVERLAETEILEQNKSVVGRAVVGTVLLGPLGGIVGGMSGIGNKTKKNHSFFLVFNYIPTGTDEVKTLAFEEVGATLHLGKFVDELKPKCSISPKNNADSIVL